MTSAVAEARLTDAQRRVLEALPDYDPSCPGVPQHQITSDEQGYLTIVIEMPRKGWVTANKVAQITGLRRSSVQRSLNILCNLQLAERSDKGWLQGIYRRTPAGTAALEAMRRAR